MNIQVGGGEKKNHTSVDDAIVQLNNSIIVFLNHNEPDYYITMECKLIKYRYDLLLSTFFGENIKYNC